MYNINKNDTNKNGKNWYDEAKSISWEELADFMDKNAWEIEQKIREISLEYTESIVKARSYYVLEK